MNTVNWLSRAGQGRAGGGREGESIMDEGRGGRGGVGGRKDYIGKEGKDEERERPREY